MLAEEITRRIESNEYNIEQPRQGGGRPWIRMGGLFLGVHDNVVVFVRDSDDNKPSSRLVLKDSGLRNTIQGVLDDKAPNALTEDEEARVMGWMS